MEDVLSSVAGNRMVQLKLQIQDLKKLLKTQDDPDKIAELKKLISEKQTYYNILEDRRRLSGF